MSLGGYDGAHVVAPMWRPRKRLVWWVWCLPTARSLPVEFECKLGTLAFKGSYENDISFRW